MSCARYYLSMATKRGPLPPKVTQASMLLHVAVALEATRWALSTIILLMSTIQYGTDVLLLWATSDFLLTLSFLGSSMIITFRIRDGMPRTRIFYIIIIVINIIPIGAFTYGAAALFAKSIQIYFYWMVPLFFVIRIMLQIKAFILLFAPQSRLWFSEQKKKYYAFKKQNTRR